MARVVVVGAGVVGTAVGDGCARRGHDVWFVETDAARVDALRADGFAAATSLELPGDDAFVFLTVPTPARGRSHDLSALHSAVRAVGTALRASASVPTIVVRSTVPPGTCDTVVQPLLEEASGRRGGEGFFLASCPEFLRKAWALDDFLSPRVTVIGSRHPVALASLTELFRPFGGEIMTVDNPTTAELVKCAQNAWNATKISYWNEVWQIARRIDVDADFVAHAVAIAAEGSYNPAYGIRGGAPFDGSCLQKDTEGLAGFAASVGVPTPLLEAVLAVNAGIRAPTPPADG